ncbi:MAG: hypothetical protein HY689_02140 [Chloroflexi bacterium]|nr:hypothetical protein [Chloroflexota bacterium]
MPVEQTTPADVQRLADDVREKILANQDTIIRSDGEISIRVFRRGRGFDVKLQVNV